MISFPNAKINLGLRVLDKRADGFHNISSFFVPVALHDALEIIPHKPALSIKVSGIIPDGSPSENIVVIAYQMLQERFGIAPCEIHLHKGIPYGAGLGGGSSDAAASLSLLNQAYDLSLKHQELIDLAMELGSDCGFFMHNQICLVEGRGEIIKPMAPIGKKFNILILKPEIFIPTAEAYKKSRFSSVSRGFDPKLLSQAFWTWREVLTNDFETWATQEFPLIRQIIDQLYTMGAGYAALSGSGSAVYGLFEEEIGSEILFKDVFIWRGTVVI